MGASGLLAHLGSWTTPATIIFLVLTGVNTGKFVLDRVLLYRERTKSIAAGINPWLTEKTPTKSDKSAKKAIGSN